MSGSFTVEIGKGAKMGNGASFNVGKVTVIAEQRVDRLVIGGGAAKPAKTGMDARTAAAVFAADDSSSDSDSSDSSGPNADLNTPNPQ